MSTDSSLNLSAFWSTDRLPINNTSPALLDMDKVAAHIQRALDSGRYQGPTELFPYLLDKQCLVAVDDGFQVSPAGMLCFGRNPQAFFPRAVIDIGHYRGTDVVSFEVVHLEKDIGGTLFDQLTRVESYLWNNIHHGMTLNDTSFRRVDVHEYPRVVIRELCVNMIAHRDYTNFRSAARVQLFRNRIEWASPGGLPPGVTVENILFEQASRNPVIVSILYEAGYIEAFGQGLNTVVAELEQEGMSAPHFHDTGASFIVTIYGRPIDIFYGEGVYTTLTESQRKVLALIRARRELAPRDILAQFDDRGRRSIQRDLRRLMEVDLVYAVGEGRALRYRFREPSV